MKIVLQISLVLFVAVAVVFGEASEEVEMAIEHCYEYDQDVTNDGDEQICYDYDVMIKCLKTIKPANDEDKERLEDSISYQKARKAACPGSVSKTECIDSVIYHCMEKYEDSTGYGKAECKEVNQARDCLTKFNSTCIEDVIAYHIDVLDSAEYRCLNGYYEGPCSQDTVTNCTNVVYQDIVILDEDEGLAEFACKPDEVEAAKTCLADLKTNCPKEMHQDIIVAEMKSFHEDCPFEE